MLSNNKIQIAMLELSDQNRAVLEFYFNTAGESLYTLVSEDKADAFIIDYDFPGAKDIVTQRLNIDKKPLIILSVKEQNLASTIWLEKPLSANALSKAAEQLQEIMIAAEIPSIQDTAFEASVIEENIFEECIVKERAVDESIVEESTFEESTFEENVVEESIVEEPIIKDSIVEVLVDEEGINEESIVEQSVVEESVVKANTVKESNSKESVIQNTLVEKITSKTVTTGAQKSETNHKQAIASGDSETLMFEDEPSLDDGDNIFDMLNENQEDIDEDEKIEARLAMPSAAALFSATNDAKDELDSDDSQDKTKNTQLNEEFNEISHLDFTNVTIESDSYQHTESESEIDALLEALILGEGNKGQVKSLTDTASPKLDNDSSDISNQKNDISLKSLSLDTDLINDVTGKKQTVTLKDEKLKDVYEDKTEDNLDIAEQDENKQVDIDLLAEDIAVAEDSEIVVEEIVIEEKVSFLLAENPIITDDFDPSNDIDDADSLEVNNDNSKDEDSIDDTENNEIELGDTDLLAEGIAFEEDILLVVDEKESLLLAENFTMYDDINPTDEVVFADTLEVNYEDLKDGELKTESPNNEKDVPELSAEIEEASSGLELESYADQIQAEADAKTNLEASLDLDLFSSDLESNQDTLGIIKPKKIAAEELPLSILDETSSTDIANFESKDSDGITLDNADTNLDKLLEQISTETENFISDETPKIIETDPAIVAPTSITQTTLIEDDFVNKSKFGSVNKEKENFDLQSLLNEVREEAVGSDSDSIDGDSVNSKFKTTDAEKRWVQLCGSNIRIATQKEAAKISFIPENHLLKVLLDKIELVKGSEQLYRIKYNDLIIVLDHSENSIYCNLPVINDEFSEICFSEIEQKNLKIHDLDYSEVRLYRSKIKKNPGRAHTIESFIWSMSLLTSRGRLPKGTDVTKKIGLKIWPNLTRVELPPHAIQIAAVLNNNPGNLLEIPEWLKLEQRYVFAFYNAMLSLNMIELDSSKLKKQSSSFGNKNSKGKEQRSFFGRLIKRLKS